jgi:hypothetical protein
MSLMWGSLSQRQLQTMTFAPRRWLLPQLGPNRRLSKCSDTSRPTEGQEPTRLSLATDRSFGGQAYLAQIGPMRGRAADGIADCGVHSPIEIRALRTEGVIACDAQIRTCLPPTVLPDHNARMKLVVQSYRLRRKTQQTAATPSAANRPQASCAPSANDGASLRGTQDRFCQSASRWRLLSYPTLKARLSAARAYALGCEGVVSKRLGSTYRSGRADCWLNVKNPNVPAVRREAKRIGAAEAARGTRGLQARLKPFSGRAPTPRKNPVQ